jgi:hypothetical protein
MHPHDLEDSRLVALARIIVGACQFDTANRGGPRLPSLGSPEVLDRELHDPAPARPRRERHCLTRRTEGLVTPPSVQSCRPPRGRESNRA